MIKNTYTKIQRINATTIEMLLTFEDIGINLEQYTHIIDRLDSFKLYLTSEYLTKFENNYNKTSGQLLMELTIIIPDNLMPIDNNKALDVSKDITDLYKIFYEAQNEIYKKNYQNNDESFKIK
jgi:hypothetical protein